MNDPYPFRHSKLSDNPNFMNDDRVNSIELVEDNSNKNRKINNDNIINNLNMKGINEENEE